MKILRQINTIKIFQCEDNEEMAEIVGNKLIAQIKSKSDSNIAIQSGYSIVPLSKYLKYDRKKHHTSYKNAKFFMLNEYGVIDFKHQETHKSFMDENFFGPLKIKEKNIFYPNKDKSTSDFSKYDRLIWAEGGIDLAIISVGTNGEIGFNVPGSSFSGLTHSVKLPICTMKSESHCYRLPVEKIPKIGITMGLFTILNCRQIILIASGDVKSESVSKFLKGEVDHKWPITALLKHKNVEVFLDSHLVNGLKKYMKNI